MKAVSSKLVVLTKDYILRTERALRGGHPDPQCSLPVCTADTAARTDVPAVTESMFSRCLYRSNALAHLTGHDCYHVQSRETRSYRFEPAAALAWMDGGQRTTSETGKVELGRCDFRVDLACGRHLARSECIAFITMIDGEHRR